MKASATHGGKGSARRPCDTARYAAEHERIFGDPRAKRKAAQAAEQQVAKTNVGTPGHIDHG